MTRSFTATACALFVFGCVSYSDDYGPYSAGYGPAVVQNDYIAAKTNYARHLNEVSGIDHPSFRIIQNFVADYPIGTILSNGMPVTECAPDPKKIRENRMAMLPPSQEKRSFKLDVSTSSFPFLRKIFELTHVGVQTEKIEYVELGFSNPKQRMLYEDDLEDLLSSSACKKAIVNRDFIFVRGQITAKQKFNWDKTRGADLTFKIEEVANFLIGRKNGAPVSLEDTEEFAHFFI